ncbi:MAG: hypothetical protein ACOYJG_12955 [Prevotella sp.]
MENGEYNQRLRIPLVIISIMTLLLLASLLYVNSQRRRLAEASDNLSGAMVWCRQHAT